MNSDIEEEEFLKGDVKPCWCCARNLKTAATLVAIIILYGHCVVLFILLGFFIFETDPAIGLAKYTGYQIALVVASIASVVYIPLAYGLLYGILKGKIWLCMLWFFVMAFGTLVDFGMLAVDDSLGFIIFACCFFIARFYVLYVVWAYITVVRHQRTIYGKYDQLSKSMATVNAGDVQANVVENLSEIAVSVDGQGDSTISQGLDVDRLSHDSIYETLKAAQATDQVA